MLADTLDAWCRASSAAAPDYAAEVPFRRWDHSEVTELKSFCMRDVGPLLVQVYDPDRLGCNTGRSYCRHAAFIDGLDLFADKVFKISPEDECKLGSCKLDRSDNTAVPFPATACTQLLHIQPSSLVSLGWLCDAGMPQIGSVPAAVHRSCLRCRTWQPGLNFGSSSPIPRHEGLVFLVSWISSFA